MNQPFLSGNLEESPFLIWEFENLFGWTLCYLCNLQIDYHLKVDVHILPCVFFSFSWLTLTSEMHFVRFHPQSSEDGRLCPEVASCLLSWGKQKVLNPGDEAMRKWNKKFYLYTNIKSSPFLSYLKNYKEFEGEILELQIPTFIWNQKYFQLSPGK